MRRRLAALLITILSFVAASAQTSDAKTSGPDPLKGTSATGTTSDEANATETASNESTDGTGGPASTSARVCNSTVSPRFAVEGAYNFHNVFFSGDSFQFSTVQGGVRFGF